MKRLLQLALGRPPAGELDEEFAFHLEMRARELMEQGWEPDAARAEALRLFGDLEGARVYCEARDQRRGERAMRREWMQELRQDLAWAARTLGRAPGFTLVAVLTLALGIGANTAIFSVVRGILFRPLPFHEPGRLAAVLAVYQGTPLSYHSPANLVDLRDRTRAFSDVAILSQAGAVLTGAGEPERLTGADVSAGFFDLLGVRPVAGRLRFTDAEAAWQGPRVVILNETLWRNRFGGDPGLVGRLITLDDERYEVVGIAPARSAWPAGAMVWYPFTYDPAQLAGSRGAVYLNAIGRLRPGATFQSAAEDLGTVAAALEQQYPEMNRNVSATAVPLQERITQSMDQPLYILLGGVGFVLLIACANVAGLLLVRGLAREGELALRTAIGAGRGRLLRQLVTESVVLALLGAVAGLGVAAVGLRALLRMAPASIPRLEAVQLDGQVLGVTLLVAVATGLLFGFLPARLALRPDLTRALREGGRGGGQAGSLMARRALVTAQVALSIMLLAGAGLLIRSFNRLMQVDPGFRTAGTVSFGLSLPNARYPDRERQAAFVRALLEQLQAIPGVQHAAVGMGTPLTGFHFNFSFAITGRPAAPGEEPSAEVRVASADYLTTMGIPVLRGRGFTGADRTGGPRALVLTESAARKFFPGENPIGHQVRFGWGQDGVEGEIVGVVGDVRQFSLAGEAQPMFWVAYDQRPVASFDVLLHSARELESVVHDARQVVARLDPNLAVSQVRTLEDIVATSVAQPRFYMVLLALFAAVAIGLSGVGIYGVIAYLVGRRAREIGIRLALGASRMRVVGLVLHEVVLMAVVGVGLGLAGAAALSRVLESLLFGVSATDPLTYLAATLLLGLVALSACVVPAVRAARLDPALTMRTE